MKQAVAGRLAESLAREMREQRESLTQRWFDRIAARLTIEPHRIFPTDQLLDHVPVLLDGIADYLEDPTDEITADAPVTAKAIELGALRHDQGFGADEILKEYELLGGVLFSFLGRATARFGEGASPAELAACAQRLFRAVSVIQQVTTNHYLRLTEERVRQREERLQGFNRTVSHELKNRIGAVLGAAEVLQEEWIHESPEQIDRFAAIVSKNALAMKEVLDDLLAISRVDADSVQARDVLFPEAVAEVVRQLREPAGQAAVQVRVRAELPEVEVDAPIIELCLNNYLSNAIKYHDPGAEERWVEVWGEVRDSGASRELVVGVRDNGIGVPEPLRDQLFRRFFRAENATDLGVEGTGLGLSIVRETIGSLGGRAWAEFEEERGSLFLISIPLAAGLPPAAEGSQGA